MGEKIRVFLADDHAVVLRGLQALIETELDMEVVGTAADGQEAIDRVVLLHPDVILLDLKMPRKSGLEAITEIRERLADARILMLTSYADDASVLGAIRAGAIGYLLKEASPREVIEAIRHTHEGKTSLSPDVARKVIEEISRPPEPEEPLTEEPLTEREVEILRYVARGLSNQAIADILVVSERTVRTHLSNVLHKLHLANRTQATLYALREGITSLDDE